MPDTTFGVFSKDHVGLPGSIRSGEYPRKKSTPARRPDSSSNGRNSSSVVPGYVVDSRTTSAPGLSARASVAAADSTNERSGAPSRSGVGTEITAMSNPARSST